MLLMLMAVLLIFFFNDTATTEIYTNCHTLSLHAALPICRRHGPRCQRCEASRLGLDSLRSYRGGGKRFGGSQGAGLRYAGRGCDTGRASGPWSIEANSGGIWRAAPLHAAHIAPPRLGLVRSRAFIR